MRSVPVLVAAICFAGCAVDFPGTDLDFESFSLSPSSVDVTNSAQTVTCSMTITTTGSPVLDAGCRFIAPDGTKRGCRADSGVDDVWSCEVEIKSNDKCGGGASCPGTPWVVEYIWARQDNSPSPPTQTYLTHTALEADIPNCPDCVISAASDLDLAVESANADSTPPSITAFAVTPSEPSPTGDVTCTITATDPGSGVQQKGCSFRHGGGELKSCVVSTGDSCTIPLPADVPVGTWPVRTVWAQDFIGNVTTLTRAGVTSLGGAGEFTVNSQVGWPGPAQGTACPVSDTTPIGAGCICDGSYYTSGYCLSTGYSFHQAPTNNYYVVKGGTGLADGTDWANAASDLPSPMVRDTTYWVAAGDYNQTNQRNWSVGGGSSSAGIMVRKPTTGQHGTEAGWNAQYASGQVLFGPITIGSSHWTIDGGNLNGFEFLTPDLFGAGEPENVVDLTIAADSIVIRRVEIDANFGSSDGITHTQGTCHALSADDGTSDLVIDRTEMWNFADDGVQIHSCTRCRFFRNRIHLGWGAGTDGSDFTGPCFNGHSDGLEVMFSTDNVELVSNIIYDMRGGNAALIVQDIGTQGGNTNFSAYNNIFYSPYTGFSANIQDITGGEFHNNIVWGRAQPVNPGEDCRYGGIWIESDSVTNFNASNNIFTCINFTHGANPPHDPLEQVLTYNLYGSVRTDEYTADPTDLVADPAWASANPFFQNIPYSELESDHGDALLNFRLTDFDSTAGSPAINNGTALGPNYAWTVDGEARPQGASWDMGAFDEATGTFTGFAVCGNATVEPGEDCEAGVAITDTCADLGFGGGTLACDEPNCAWNTSGCTGTQCQAMTDFSQTVGFSTPSQETLADSALTFEFYMRPTASGQDAGIMIDDTNTTTYANGTALVRFWTNNEIQVRDGGTYGCKDGANTTCPTYSANTWYRFVVTFSSITNSASDTYTVQYEPCAGGGLTYLHDGATVRNAASQLEYYTVWSDTTNAVDVDIVSWSATCNALTCSAYDPDSCGAPPDGCGGSLSCGTCTNPDVCDNSFQCCTPDADPCANLYSPSKNCGSWANNCDQIIGCGSCPPVGAPTETVCNDGVCCAPESQATTCGGDVCGTKVNNCGETISCGTCPSDEVCSSGACVTPTNWWETRTEPDATNTGPNPTNCPSDWAHGGVCPNTSLTNIGSCPTITVDGTTQENFECTGRIRIQANNVTLRNFKVNVSGGLQGLLVEGSVSGNVVEFGHIDGTTDADCNEALWGRGFTGRYLHAHSCADVMKIGNEDSNTQSKGPLVIEHSYLYDPNGGHADTFQVWEHIDAGSSVTIRDSSLECGATTSCLITTSTVGSPITFERNWIYGNGTSGVFRCGWDAGDYGGPVPPGSTPAISVKDTLVDGNYVAFGWGGGGGYDDCFMCNTRLMSTKLHVSDTEANQEGTDCP